MGAALKEVKFWFEPNGAHANDSALPPPPPCGSAPAPLLHFQHNRHKRQANARNHVASPICTEPPKSDCSMDYSLSANMHQLPHQQTHEGRFAVYGGFTAAVRTIAIDFLATRREHLRHPSRTARTTLGSRGDGASGRLAVGRGSPASRPSRRTLVRLRSYRRHGCHCRGNRHRICHRSRQDQQKSLEPKKAMKPTKLQPELCTFKPLPLTAFKMRRKSAPLSGAAKRPDTRVLELAAKKRAGVVASGQHRTR